MTIVAKTWEREGWKKVRGKARVINKEKRACVSDMILLTSTTQIHSDMKEKKKYSFEMYDNHEHHFKCICRRKFSLSLASLVCISISSSESMVCLSLSLSFFLFSLVIYEKKISCYNCD